MRHLLSFRDLSLKRKLTVVLTLTSALVLTAAFLAFFVFERINAQSALGRELASLADVVAANTTAALSFEDAQGAEDVLSTLRLRPNVVSASLYDTQGHVFASYRRKGEAGAVPTVPEPDGTRVEASHVRIFHAVMHDGERIGTLYIDADTSEVDARLHRFGAAILVLMAFGFVGALLLAQPVQALISGPILRLAEAATRVSENRDYGVRVPKAGADEIGGLTDAFNGMLVQIQARDGALQEAQRELQARVEELLQEVADRKAAQAALRDSEEHARHRALHDALTNLPNRTLLHDRLNLAIAQANRAERKLAILFLDLDRFKLVNDTLGHTMGDGLLTAVAERLTHRIREADTLARVGGDEFIVILPNVHADTDAAAVAAKILDALKQPFHLGGRDLFVSASVGISVYPDDGTDGETLIKNADAAMYRAKEQGRDTYHMYLPELQERAIERMTLEQDVRRAVARGEFRLHYQPIVDFQSGRIVGAEALLRWDRPGYGLVGPTEVIAVAEETGLIQAVGSWALSAACHEARLWDRPGYPPVRISVNLCARQLQHQDLIPQLATILKETGLSPGLLSLEITETVVMENLAHTMVMLERIKDLGVRLSIDDFGTGYSSLSYLKRFPFDALKIDRSFIQDIDTDPRNAAVAQAIVALARGLGIDVIAEGVETAAQHRVLLDQGCHSLQGYFFSPALAGDAFQLLLGTEPMVGAHPPNPRGWTAAGH